MTGSFFLDWGVISVSVFNTIILFWLALTVLLNAQRKRFGVWLAGLGMTMGSFFFAIHTVIIYNGFTYTERQIEVLWSLGWTLLLILPVAWYMLILWYLGFWENERHYLQNRQKYWFIVDVILFVITARYVLFTNTLPTFIDFASLDMSNALSIRNIPLLMIIYPLYILLSITLSVDALRFPGPNFRIMGDTARMRARPWLIASSCMLLIVSLMVTSFMVWVVFNSWKYQKYDTYFMIYSIVEITDLVISSFISLAVLSLGQAITSYEIFTGNTLPRRGLFRNWLNTIFLAAAYSIIIGAGLTGRIAVIHYLIFTAFLMTGFYVMANKRFYIERERFMSELYPFVKTQNIYNNLLNESEDAEHSENSSFYAMCKDILETEKACLIPLGYFSPLINKKFYFPEISECNVDIDSIVNKENLHNHLCYMLSSNNPDKYILYVPLWNEKGLTGLLFIGKKIDNGLYSQEEIQIARSISERIIDIHASTQMAKTLIDTQRKKMTETKLIDSQTRRILHDDILPILHTSIIDINSDTDKQEIISSISSAHKKISDLLANNGNDNLTKVSKDGLIKAVKIFVEKEMKNHFESINWEINQEAEEYLINLSLTVNEVIFYAIREIIRNSAKYAKNEQGKANLTVKVEIDKELKIIIEDDGQGINSETKSIAGSGQGLKLHSTMIAVIGGYLSVESEKNHFTRISIVLPIVDLDTPILDEEKI